MSSRARNFRRRGADEDDDNDKTTTKGTTMSATTKPQSKPSTAISRKPNKPPNQAPKSLLSFADDEETDSPFSRPSAKPSSASRFTKFSSSSHKLTAAKDRLAPSSSTLPSNVQPQAGTYTKEALLELQKNTKTLVSSRSRPTPKAPSEPIVVLKGLLKPSIKTEADEKTMEKFQSEENDVAFEKNDMGIEKDYGLSRTDREKDDTVAGLGKLGLGKGKDSLIPDQETINAIRAKRERLRQAGAAAPDYIALDSGSNHGEAEGLSDEEPEFKGRIGFLGEKIDCGRKGVGVFEDVDESGICGGFRKDVEVGGSGKEDDDEDEEDKIWEEEQFRKALGKRMDDGASRVATTSNVPVVQTASQQKFIYASVANAYPSVPNVTVGSSGPSIGGAVFPGFDVLPISQQANLARKALQENVMRLKESHGRTIASLNRTEENLSASLSNVTALESSLSAAGEKYIFMQKIRDFVSVMCDFLQHKAPFIEELEDQMLKLYKERAAAILERRSADNEDEMREIEVAASAAMSVLTKTGSNSRMIEAASTAAEAAVTATRELRNLPVELDEFGRDTNLQKRMDLTRRSEARHCRRAQSEAQRMSLVEKDSSYQRIEGESSTDESDTESTAYQSNRDQLVQIAGEIFSDAAEEYSRLQGIVAKFERWKKCYSSSYYDAYMSLSIPAIFSPYVRLELLKWDPLHEEADFIDMQWHSLLLNYGLREDDKKEISHNDADYNLIPALVEKLAIPILHHQLESWDMLSARETKLAVSATNLILRYVPASSTSISNLIAVLRDRLTHAVANLMVPTWNTLVMKTVPNAGRVAAYRFGMSIRLMRNICLWSDILAMPVLEKLALDDLLSGKVLPHLWSIQSDIHDAIARSERIIASLSGVWVGTNVKRSPKMQPLVDYLIVLGKMLEKKHVSVGMETENGGLAHRLKKMLVELNEYDHARAISRTFNLRDAL